MFKNRKLFKEFISGVREHRYATREVQKRLEQLPIRVIKAIGKEIVFSDYDGYNYCSIDSEMCYFDSLNRDQKEFYIEERLYKLCR